jgi:hypothetical protein
MKHIEIAEQIARDSSCAQGQFNERVLAIIPYLAEQAAEIERLRAALDIARSGLLKIERQSEEARAALTKTAHQQSTPQGGNAA